MHVTLLSSYQINSFLRQIHYHYRYSALGPVWAETRAQSGDWYVSGTLHPGQILRGSLPLLSPVEIDISEKFLSSAAKPADIHILTLKSKQ